MQKPPNKGMLRFEAERGDLQMLGNTMRGGEFDLTVGEDRNRKSTNSI